MLCFKIGGARAPLCNGRNSPVEKGRMKRFEGEFFE